MKQADKISASRENEDERKKNKLKLMTEESKELEKEINLLIKKFEKKHKLSCWISHPKPNQICIDFSIDGEKL